MQDIQKTPDTRGIPIDKVGITKIHYPLKLTAGGVFLQETQAQISLYVSLKAQHKGTHMSRFIEILHKHHQAFKLDSLAEILEDTKQKLGSEHAYIEAKFPYFLEKQSPVTGQKSLMDYRQEISSSLNEADQLTNRFETFIPIKTLCPCSKAISEYGAHNQRSLVRVSIHGTKYIQIEKIIRLVESSASAELYALLKRADEKHVTEQAYQNPAFVEDIVREIAQKLTKDLGIERFEVSSENFESIHNHNAYAYIQHSKGQET